jgi:hypothetical protein
MVGRNQAKAAKSGSADVVIGTIVIIRTLNKYIIVPGNTPCHLETPYTMRHRIACASRASIITSIAIITIMTVHDAAVFISGAQ